MCPVLYLGPRWPRLTLSWWKLTEVRPKLDQIGHKLAQVGISWSKLAALVRSNLKKCSLPRQGA